MMPRVAQVFEAIPPASGFAKKRGKAYFWLWNMVQTEYIWDPLRKKSVRNTPEEAVRQWFIAVLHEGMKVPEHMMGSEVSITHAGKAYRADIVVWDRSARPLMVVECKRPEVALDQAVVDQALRYNNELDVKYIVITNGERTFMFVREEDGFVFLEKAPLWEEMLA
jgi:hypothetical protein